MSSAPAQTEITPETEVAPTAAERVQAKFVEEAKKGMEERQAAHDEYLEFEALLGRVTGTNGSAPTPLRVVAPRKPQAARAGSAPRASSASSGGDRRAEFEAIVLKNPDGIKIADIAKEMGIQSNYLYRIGKDAEADGVVAKGPDKKYRPSTT